MLHLLVILILFWVWIRAKTSFPNLTAPHYDQNSNPGFHSSELTKLPRYPMHALGEHEKEAAGTASKLTDERYKKHHEMN